MKLTIFVVEWICLQILSTQCDVFLNNLNSSDLSTKVCIQKSINHLFSYDDTLSLILDNDICEDAIFEMNNTTRPYISLNLDTVKGIKLQYEGKFIICPVDASSLARTVYRMQDEAKMYYRGLGNSKILVITNTTDVSFIFEMFWSYGINNVIILFYGQGIPKLSMCDRYSPENACGTIVKSIIYQNCEEQVTFSFTNLIHQMNKCPITFMYAKNSIYVREKEFPTALYILYVIQELSNRRNATFQRIMYNHSLEFMISVRNKTNIVMGWATNKCRGFTITEPVVEFDLVWFVPKAEQISNLNVFVHVFSCSVWVAVVVTLICTWLTWFVIISWNGKFTFEKLGLAFMNVWSLTICGSIAQFPRSFALRITLLSYLIYVIHIQCAFTSNMATILTTPRYGFQIRNLEQLAESGLPIYILKYLKMTQFNLSDTNHTLYTRLQKQLHVVSTFELIDALAGFNHYRNYAVIATKIDVYQIHDNSMTGVFTIRLALPADHYFVSTLNSLLSELVESGIGDKRKNDFERECFTKNVSMQENSEELTLPHLTFIFIFLGLGLSISGVVFCLEHVVHKFL
ncbi:hypothetical protein RI129_006556 [Pyrocoelia pectoralis]|uniref:Ionotropic glutamate receptor C-terminal domain-containing protein n=1 Tax=Pyrocoelia pectoralis TaxID=417401 RepID=A0AAN7VHD6_9COLE